MKFFSGFSLTDDISFFDAFILKSDFTVSGFSYGAIKAFLFVRDELNAGRRVDRLQLFSPAFFQTKSEKFKRLQLLAYTKNTQEYTKQFLGGCFHPYIKKTVSVQSSTKEELNELLYYEWSKEALKELSGKGVVIEVYLGGKDAIIDVNAAREFFLDVATVTYIKDGNHFLLTS